MTKLALAMVTLVVPDYDEAIDHYVGALGFSLIEDTLVDGGKRCVVVSPGAGGGRLLLARAANESQAAVIGRQAGGRVGFFLQTSDMDQSIAAYRAAGVVFDAPPRSESYGRVAVFADRYGNRWDLIEPVERKVA